MAEIPKIKSITVDTFTALQKNEIIEKWAKGKIAQEDWKDYGIDIINFIKFLQQENFECVGILGYEGSGKSYGMKGLPTNTNIWYNADGKNCTFLGGRKEYGLKTSPTIYQKLPKTYDDIINSITAAKKANLFAPNPVAFLLAHVEDYKSVDNKQRLRLKTMGKVANKLNIEDAFTMCYYSEVLKDGDKLGYKLRTKNNGSDTCRTMENQHDDLYIDNNFQIIIDSIDKY